MQQQVAGYDNLTAYLNTTFGYTTGKDLFALPYDWRQDLVAMDQKIDAVSPKLLDRLAARIRRIVASNGGRKAVLITHSMGGIVALELLTKPRFAAWRCVQRVAQPPPHSCTRWPRALLGLACAHARAQGGKRARFHHAGHAIWWSSRDRCVQGGRLPLPAA